MSGIRYKQDRVLFVAHDAYRAGATIFLLNMLRWLKAHTELQFEVATRDDGEMVAEFERVCPTTVLVAPSEAQGLRARLRQWRHPGVRRRQPLRALIQSRQFDLLYLNTITLGDQLAALGRAAVPVITHVHELPSAIRRYARGKEQFVIEHSERLICVSDAVADNLLGELGAPQEKVSRIYGFVPVDKRPEGTDSERREGLLRPLGIPAGAMVIGLCGHGDIRKGADLLVPLARLLPRHVGGRAVHMVWVGLQAPEYPRDVALSDAHRAGVADRVHLPGPTTRPVDWMSLFDLHVMLSREDPFPLVVMEAANLAIPTLAFQGAGGAAEFIRNDAGRCSPFLDLPAMAAAITELLADDQLRMDMGKAAYARVRQRHAPQVVLPQIVQLIDEVLRGSYRQAHQGNPR